MGKRSNWTSRATDTDREAPFDPASERSAGMMLAAFRSHWEDAGPAPADERCAGGDEAGFLRTSALARSGDLSLLAKDFPAAFDLAMLDGSNGFRLDGIDRLDRSGYSVSSAGDVNGDGFDDIIIGASYGDPGFKPDAGESYVVFGKAGGFAASFDLATLDGSNGFQLDGTNRYDRSGYSVSSAGDVNGDGFDDIIVGSKGEAPGGDYDAGESYVVFGKAGGFAASLSLATLDGSDGFRIDGIDAYDYSGRTLSSAGDVNGDGFDDVIIGSFANESYVIFGKAGGFAASLDLATLDGSNGFRLDGVGASDDSGASVSSAGDVNGDGFDDIIVGAASGDPGGDTNAGESYVVFGKAGGFAASFDLSALDGGNGFRIDGVDAGDLSGFSVSSAGDVNGDGFDDVIIGGASGDPGGDRSAGESYVVFGKAGGFAATLDLATLNGSNGFRLDGVGVADYSGFVVSSAGDVNGDGFDDIIVGAYDANAGGDRSAGQTYVVFGKASGFAASIDLAALDGSDGLRLDGIDLFDRSGRSVSSAGDVNGDGFDDIIIGASDGDPDGDSSAGESYVVFGRAPTDAVTRVGSAADQTIRGGDFDDTLKGLRGDDMLAGGGGRDRLKGGAGADDFVLASLDPADADKILDFGGDDRIALDGDVFGLAEGPLAAGRFVVGTAAADASDRFVYDQGTGKLFYDADGAGAQAQVLIATLTGAPVLTAADFIVV